MLADALTNTLILLKKLFAGHRLGAGNGDYDPAPSRSLPSLGWTNLPGHRENWRAASLDLGERPLGENQHQGQRS